MNTIVPSSCSTSETLDELVQHARSLYSLPAVAAEVIQLTNDPQVDVRALKDCIEVDPALTAKILRVVNSSLFGLSRQVNDLNQAIALLGTKPLKLLVLGFSLPEDLFSKVARNQLDWFWTNTLSRAVAAREISEQLWQRPGDDAFLAGLLQDIGVLVLLGELQQPYAQFLSRVIEEHLDLQQLEVEALGFGHTALTAALLDHWKMPKLLVEAISERRDSQLLRNKKTPAAELARILHLAGLLSELVAQRRLKVLPELLEIGEAYCELDNEQLHELVTLLQPKVEQLADVLSLDICDSSDYPSVLAEAHKQMALLAESVAESLSRLPETKSQTYQEVLEDATSLRQTVHDFLNTATATVAESATHEKTSQTRDYSSTSSLEETTAADQDPLGSHGLVTILTLAVGQCRSTRQPLSLVLVEVNAQTKPSTREAQVMAHALDVACRQVDYEGMTVELLAPFRRALILPGCERQDAVNYTQSIIDAIESALARLEIDTEYVSDAGVATVVLPSKNFMPQSLLETAERCLSAAQSSEASVVKSLEVY